MGRSVVLAGAARCPRCSLPPRWCVCDALPPVETGLNVHVLIHRGEQGKPSSTGRLVARVVTGAACHPFQRQTRFVTATGFPTGAVESGGELWILHPCGDPLPQGPAEHTSAATTAVPAAPESTAAADGPRRSRRHVLLLDGTWRQAGEMLRTVEVTGRCVRLPDASDDRSRYWLRDQPAPMRLSTAEALMGVLRSVGEHEAEHRLRLHFELHVYATLLARGRREMAERYLGHSPLPNAAAEALDRLHACKHG